MSAALTERLGVSDSALRQLCEHWGIAELAVFGSALRDDFGPNSDIDLLVTFARGVAPSFRERLAIEDELGTLFGRRVDLVSRRSVERTQNYIVRRSILSSAEPVYAAGQ